MADEGMGEYEDKPIRRLALEVRNTAGGLNAAMKVDGERIHAGERRFIVYDVVFDKFRFDPMDDGDAWCLVSIGSASAAAFLEEESVKEQLQASREAQVAISDEAKGRRQLDDEDEGLLATAHGLGQHNDESVEGCPDCDDAGLDPVEREVKEKLGKSASRPV